MAAIAMATMVAVVILLGGGMAYRVFASLWKMSADRHIELPIRLSQFPQRVGDWIGEELEIEPGTVIYMERNFADDYVTLRYVNSSDQLWADVYIVFCATRMAGILGHQPRVCYPGNGWIWERTIPSRFITSSGRAVECLVHSFRKPSPSYQQVHVLNYYVLNGRITLSEKEFSGWFGRRPNLAGDPARYVAQVQISSTIERAPKTLASLITEMILAFLPDESGHVAAADAPEQLTQAERAAHRDR